MPLSNEDCVELIRTLQSLVRQYEPELLGYLEEKARRDLPPPRYLLSYVDQLLLMTEEYSQTGGDHTLRQLNKFVKTEDGSPIERVFVVLSDTDREIYGTDSVDLSLLPDRQEFIRELRAIRNSIRKELDLDQERERET
jgi:hypothetical protein